MTPISESYGAVLAGGSVVNLARLETVDGELVVPSDIATASYSVREAAGCDALEGSVPGHEQNPLPPGGVLHENLATGAAWQVDQTGYNFRHEIDVREQPAFPVAGKTYSVVYRLVPVEGQPILFRYFIKAV